MASFFVFAVGIGIGNAKARFEYFAPWENLFPVVDTVKPGSGGSDSLDLVYPIEDRQGDHLTSDEENPFVLDDPSSIEKTVEYDPETNRFIITETLDGRPVRPPTYMTYDEYLEYESTESRRDYYNERLESISLVERQGIVPKIYTKGRTMDRLFGGNTIDIRPSGNIDLTFGGNVQKIDNPILTEQARKQGGFDFDMNINMNVVGSIGDKLKINLSYNTGATFDFENQIKLKYEGEEDDIIKLIEAGNVSFPLKTSLIQGTQSLFGVHTRLQFGRLTIENVYSQQKSKTQNLTIQDGAQTQTFQVFSDEYDENRHFFLTHAFRDQYDEALANLPNINSLVQVTRLEVWVTNRTGVTQDVRDIVAFQDLAEPNRIHNPTITPTGATNNRPANGANSLYGNLVSDPSGRTIDNISQYLIDNNLEQIEDFEKTFARKLTPSEYTFNPQLGYISLNQALYPDEVLAVAFEYTYNGEVYRVGEFAQDIPPDSTSASKVLYLKLLKSTSVRPELPLFDLMMKNIYSIGAYQVNREDFQLELFYQDPGGGLKRFVPAGSLEGQQLIYVMNLDNLNTQLDPQRDGVFDFIPGITINPNNGRIIFTSVEPFGSYLREQFEPDEQNTIAENYVYDELYDSIKVIAQQYPQFNRFVIKGRYKSSVSSEIALGAFNVPEGSVTVTAGGQQLVEGRDYTVDYSLGRVKIINEGILNSGVPINVNYENNALFGFQQKTLFGTRMDYRVSDKLNFGFTYLHLKERPFTQKVNIGDDPISNGIWGFDMNYNTESQFLTWLVDKLPFYSTKEPSSFSLQAEMARLNPGHSKVIGDEGVVYIDDFEGASSSYDLKFPATNWRLSSTPKGASSPGVTDLFPEADLLNDLTYGFNRGKITWYNLDPVFTNDVSSTPDYLTKGDKSNHYVRQVPEQEVFPNRTQVNAGINNNLLTFDITYYPSLRGPYNFESTANGQPGISSGVNPDGTLKAPQTRWGGITRSIDNNNFEAANIEFIEFWLMDPFIYNDNSSGGDLYINLGNISEDVLKDSRFFYENGLPTPGSTVQMDITGWGRVPRVQPIVNAFDNDPDAREAQDVGYDGWNDEQERDFYADFLNEVQNVLDPAAFQQLQDDPAQDNYQYYLDGAYDNIQAPILSRYKKFNGPQGNSPVQTGNNISSAATNIPDSEDLNRDNTVNENESYFQYRINLTPNMEVGQNFITDIQEVDVTTQDNVTSTIKWYQFKVPIQGYDSRVGSIPDFKSIRFMRMFLTGFEDSVTLRFARLELVRNQWRRYLQNLREPGEYVPNDNIDDAFFNVFAVNVEENSERQPIPYVLPEGIVREQNLNTQNVNALQNEQSLSVQVCGLQDGDARAIYKNLNLDIRQYETMKMFVHAESLVGEAPINDGDLTWFIRLGSDFTENFYEYEIPMTITPPTATDDDADLIWPEANELVLDLDSLINLKLLRDQVQDNNTLPYSRVDSKGNTYTIVGNPDLGIVKIVMLGIRNPKKVSVESADDAQPKCVEVWFNELRMNGFEEEGGWAAMGRMETRLADLGTITLSANMHTIGFGQLEQKVDQRYRDLFWQYDFATNLQLGKFFPEKWGLRLPFYANVSQSFSTPQYDPYEYDVPLEAKLDLLSGSDKRDYKRQVQDRVTIKGFNFTNVRVVPTNTKKKPRFYSISNFNVTYAYSEQVRSDPLVEQDLLKKYKASFGYNFSPEEKFLYPFKKLIKSKSKWLDIIKDINFNPIPGTLTFRTDLNRQFGEVVLRPLGDDEFTIDPTYNKFFTWDRVYGISYNPFKSLSLDFNANNNARIDEPPGRLDTEEKRDSLWTNFKRFGRNTRYTHSFSATYNTPIDKLPLLDWTQVRLGYNTAYTWTAAPLYRNTQGEIDQNPFGNTLNNNMSYRINGDLNFKSLYDKWKILKPYNNSRVKFDDKEARQKKKESNQKKLDKIDDDIANQKKELDKIKTQISELKQDTISGKKEQIKQLKKQKKTIRQRMRKLRQDKKKVQSPEQPSASFIIRPLISLKRVTVSYTQDYSTVLPGYVPKTRFFGQDKGFNTPGLDFAFGKQPDQLDLDRYAANGWITPDTSLNYQFVQTRSTNLNIKATLEPLPDLRIDLTMTKNESQNYTEFFKKPSPNAEFQHLNPVTTGNYSVSFMAIRTAFEKVDDQGLTPAYTKFESLRSTYSQIFGEMNPNSNGVFLMPKDSANGVETPLPGFAEGYGPYSLDVLIPSFIAAYTGKDINKVKLNPLQTFPLPNWRLTYNGLSKIKGIDKVIKNFTVTHAYNSTMSVSSFQSNLNFDGNGYFEPSVIDTLTNNFFPQYNIPQITITEQFAPFIGVDITWANGITTKFDYKKSRQLSMSFVGYQLAESRTSEFTFGFGYRIKGLTLPFGKKKVKLKNEINFRVDVSFRDNVTINHRLDQEISEPTSGMKTIRISPTIDYVVNDRLNIRIFFDRNRSIPATSASFPITNTKAGVTLRFTLTP